MQNLKDTLKALLAAKKYSQLIGGHTITLPTGEAIEVTQFVTVQVKLNN